MSEVEISPGFADETAPGDSNHELEVGEAFARMGALIDELSGISDEEVRDKVFELLDWVDAFHREAVVRIANLLPLEALDSLREDPVVAHLLETYVETEEDDPEQVVSSLEEALDEIRPYLHSHGGEMEVLDVSDGVVKLRLMGSCHGCPSSTQTLTQGVEQILKEKWPSFRKIEVEDLEPAAQEQPNLLQIQTLRKQ